MTDNLTPNKVIGGNEHRVSDQNGRIWAGQWQRDKMDDEDMITVGHFDDPVRGPHQSAGIPKPRLFKHLMINGDSGRGKSTAMKNVIHQLTGDGHGLCLIDPIGDVSPKLLKQLPSERLDDVVWVEPGTNKDRVVGFNIFETETEPGDTRYEREVTEIVEDFVGILEDVSNQWSTSMEYVSTGIVEQLIRADEPYDIVDFTQILTHESEMEAFIEKFEDDDVLHQYFSERVDDLTEAQKDPVLRRLNKWISNRPIRQMMAHDESNISISEAVEEGKILVVDTSEIRQQDAKTVITRAIISRLWSTIKARGETPEDERDPFYLCIDKFDTVVTKDNSINDILSLARSFKLGVICSFEQYSQLPDNVATVCRAIKNLSLNPGQNSTDAASVAQIYDIGTKRVQNLNHFKAIFRPVSENWYEADEAFTVSLFAPIPPKRESAAPVIQQSLAQYGTTEVDISTVLDDYGIASDE